MLLAHLTRAFYGLSTRRLSRNNHLHEHDHHSFKRANFLVAGI